MVVSWLLRRVIGQPLKLHFPAIPTDWYNDTCIHGHVHYQYPSFDLHPDVHVCITNTPPYIILQLPRAIAIEYYLYTVRSKWQTAL